MLTPYKMHYLLPDCKQVGFEIKFNDVTRLIVTAHS